MKARAEYFIAAAVAVAVATGALQSARESAKGTSAPVPQTRRGFEADDEAPSPPRPAAQMLQQQKPVQEAYVALSATEVRREQRFRDAVEPDSVRDRRRAAISRVLAAKDADALARLGYSLFVADLAPMDLRKPASATRCAACHSRGVVGRAGGLIDDDDRGRDPPSLEGDGLLERLAKEMTAELEDCSRNGAPLVAHGIRFGSRARPEGVGTDLVIRPFGRDGRWRTIDEAVDATARETMNLVLAPEERSAIVGWISSLPAPTELPPDPARFGDEFAHYQAGRARFRTLGCAGCHVPAMPLKDGTIVRAFTDLKLHDMGASLAEKDGNRRFLTAPLWGVADSAPYLHDGRALGSLEDAILSHDGEGKAARDAYHSANVLERGEIKLYLLSLIPEPHFRVAGD